MIIDLSTLTIDDAKTKMVAAYREKRLTAQHPEGTCRYYQKIGDTDCVCAIGALFPPQDPDTQEEPVGFFTTLIRRGDVIPPMDAPTTDWLIEAQYKHDHWCKMNDKDHPQNQDIIAHAEKRFRAYIGLDA